MQQTMDCGNGLHRFVGVKRNLLVVYPGNESAAFVSVQNQRKQAGLYIESGDGFQQAGMKKKDFVAGVDAIGNDSHGKQ